MCTFISLIYKVRITWEYKCCATVTMLARALCYRTPLNTESVNMMSVTHSSDFSRQAGRQRIVSVLLAFRMTV